MEFMITGPLGGIFSGVVLILVSMGLLFVVLETKRKYKKEILQMIGLVSVLGITILADYLMQLWGLTTTSTYYLINTIVITLLFLYLIFKGSKLAITKHLDKSVAYILVFFLLIIGLSRILGVVSYNPSLMSMGQVSSMFFRIIGFFFIIKFIINVSD